MSEPLKVTTTAGRFEADYLVILAADGCHTVKVITRTGNRTIKPGSQIWRRVVRAAKQEG